MVPPSTPLDLPALVALMYRADWTTLSLSATVSPSGSGAARGLTQAGAPSGPDPEPLVTEEG